MPNNEDYVYLVVRPRGAAEEARLLEVPAGALDGNGESELDEALPDIRDAATPIALMMLLERLAG